MVIPEGTLGSRIDAVARMALWQHGLDYNHGTGHGVGAFLNVHEGPQGVGSRYREGEAGFQKGMTISNEPGYYEEGAFGIRIETILIAVEKQTAHNFNSKKYLGFETITMTPMSTGLIDPSLLTDTEVDWINTYHAQVREKLLPLMQETFPQSADFLIRETEPISKAQ
ncbi:M24 family metallopeptidase [archaeon]|nr:MAG: M24 family metallopeptidase [archaeon]